MCDPGGGSSCESREKRSQLRPPTLLAGLTIGGSLTSFEISGTAREAEVNEPEVYKSVWPADADSPRVTAAIRDGARSAGLVRPLGCARGWPAKQDHPAYIPRRGVGTRGQVDVTPGLFVLCSLPATRRGLRTYLVYPAVM